MKDKRDFINDDCFYDLDFYMKRYKEINDAIDKLKSKKEKYDKLLNAEIIEKNENELTFLEKYVLYQMIKNTILYNENKRYSEVDLHQLKIKFGYLFDDLSEYLSIEENIDSLRKRKRNITNEDIVFKVQKDSNFHCFNGHSIVIEDGELKCLYCGSLTKDYALTDEEFEFLVLCAKEQKLLIPEFTKEDWPLVKVIMDKYNRKKSLRKQNYSDDELLEELEREYYADGDEIADIRCSLKKAHRLDNKIYDDENFCITKPNYLSDEQKKKFMDNLKLELEEIKKSDSRFKDLLIEECESAKYEILILSGEHIPTLLKETTSEDEKVALTKAYYNLSNGNYRVDSGYFNSGSSVYDAIIYDCYTANSEINNRILEMKTRKK